MYDVLIIGAGIEGTAIARRLSRYALSIALVEAANDVAMGSTKANSAIVHGGYAEANAKLKGRVCYAGMPKRMPSSRAGSATRAASSLRSSTRS